MSIDFGDVFRSTWKIGWNHKVLWLFQMLPAVFSMVMLPFMFLANPAFLYMLPEPYQQYANQPWVYIVFFVVVIIMSVFATFLGVMAQTTSTLGALRAAKGTERLSFRDLITQSLPYFWRVFGLYLLFGAVWMLIMLVFMGLNVGISVLTFGLGSLCMMPLFVLIIPVALIGYSVLELAQAAIISENMRTLDALSRGWQMFRQNALSVGLLMLILYFGLSIGTSIFIFPMMFPMMLFPLSIDSSGEFNTAILWIFIALFPLMMLLIMVVQGILMAFFQSAWAVTYLRLDRGQNVPVLVEAAA